MRATNSIQRNQRPSDLYYRLNVVSITMPALRGRRDDILPLAEHFLAKHAAKAQRRMKGISREAQSCLAAYDWPGSVRELENTIERAVVLGAGEMGAGDPDAWRLSVSASVGRPFRLTTRQRKSRTR